MINDALIGKKLGQFEILEAIGSGGMATVYKARQPAMNRVVALKVLTTQMASNPTFLARFLQEAQMIASLEHAHILPVYDMGEQDGLVYIAMRFMPHGTLSSCLAQGPIALREVSRWIEQIGSALDYAHQRGVIHRDVKPSNILLDAQSNAFLADFGIAKWHEASLHLTGSGVIGTPQYMSPEQGQGLKLDGRSDEYSLAVIAYEMIVGRPPFEAETPLAIVLKHVTEPLTPPNAINPRVPQPVSDVISKALNKDPDERYPTTEVFAQALNTAIAVSPLGETKPLPSVVPTEELSLTQAHPSAAARRIRPVGLIALLVAVIMISLGGLLLIAKNQPPPDRPEATIRVNPNIIPITPTPLITSTQAIPLTVSTVVTTCAVPLYAENFDDPNSGLPHGEQDGVTWGYAGNAYQFLISEANKMQARLLGPAFAAYDVALEAHFASDNFGTYGLIVAARNANDYYALLVDGDRHYSIARRTPDGTHIIQDWTFTSALQPGQGVNRLRAVQRGSDVAFYANDVLLTIITDENAADTARQIGLTAASLNRGAVDVRFDNLRVCPPPESFAPQQVSLIDTFDDNHNGWAPQQYSASGGSTIENGRFVIDALYPGKPYGISNWNPNVAFDAFDLKVDAQIVSGTSTSRVGILFGVQDIDNLFWFDYSNDGQYHLYRRQDGQPELLTTANAPIVKSNLANNQIHLSVVSNTLTIDVNDHRLTQVAIDYTPGFVGFWCGVYDPAQTSCAFDNLQVSGTPSQRTAVIYPFCNCRREVLASQPLEVKWRWGAKSIELLNQFKANTVMTVTLDGTPIDQPQSFWNKPQGTDSEAEMFWSYNLPVLSAGSHLLEFVVHSDKEITDGLDDNGDGRPDTFGPGDFLQGYAEMVVRP